MFDRLIDVLLVVWRYLRIMTVVDADEAAVLLRWGLGWYTLGPGRHWICPLMHTTRSCKVVQGTMRMHEQTLTTIDGKAVTVSPIVTFKVVDPFKFLVEMDGGSAIDDVSYGAISEWVHRNTFDYVKDPANWSELCRKIRNAADDYGVLVVRVRFGDFALSRPIRLLGQVSGA